MGQTAVSASPHFSPQCATAWNKQCLGSGLRSALLVPSSGTLLANLPHGETVDEEHPAAPWQTRMSAPPASLQAEAKECHQRGLVRRDGYSVVPALVLAERQILKTVRSRSPDFRMVTLKTKRDMTGQGNFRRKAEVPRIPLGGFHHKHIAGAVQMVVNVVAPRISPIPLKDQGDRSHPRFETGRPGSLYRTVG